MCWQRDGRLIVSCHSDGSYCQWPVNPDTQQGEPLRSCVPYGQRPRPATWDCLPVGTNVLFPAGLPCMRVEAPAQKSKPGAREVTALSKPHGGFPGACVAFSGQSS